MRGFQGVDMLRRIFVLAVVVLVAGRAQAAVTDFQVMTRTDVPGTTYERLTGRLTYRVDPEDARNRGVVDLDKAPRDADGRVVFHGDVVIMRPKTGGSGIAIIDVANRGRATVFGLNHARGNDA